MTINIVYSKGLLKAEHLKVKTYLGYLGFFCLGRSHSGVHLLKVDSLEFDHSEVELSSQEST